MAKIVSPSRIARYFFQECDRYLRFSSTPSAARAHEGVPVRPFDTRPVTAAILESGFAWEEQVLDDHLGDRCRVAEASQPEQPVHERIHSAEQTRDALTSIEPGQYLYQPTLITPDRFYESYGIDRTVVAMSESRPDLIECYADDSGLIRLRVIDVKASPGLKLSHRIQATVYTLILDHLLAEWELEDRAVAGEGGVWLAQQPEPEYFEIRSMRPPLEKFLREELQPLMERPAEEARWHLYFRCEWCDYFDHCLDEMKRTDNVSRVPYLSTHAKRYLGELDPSVATVSQFSELLSDDGRVPLIDDCASLRGRADQLAAEARALQSGEVEVLEGASLAMPRAEHVRTVITIQTEPVSGEVYAYGIYAQGLRDIFGENPKPLVRVAEAGDPETVAELERTLVRDLHGLLRPVHDFNADRAEDWWSQKALQVYAFDTYERELLTGVLLRRVLDSEVSEQALELFFYFQRPELMQAEDHPAESVFFPVVVLLQVLRSLFALPVDVTYRFADAVELMAPSEYAFNYRDDEFFSFRFSNQMRSDAIYGVWYEGRADWIQSITKQIRARLWATNSLINGLREHLEGTGSLFAWPPKFLLPAAQAFQHPTLSKIAFFARYESVVSYLDIREQRMAPTPARLRYGDSLALTYDGGDRFILDKLHRDRDISPSGFRSWLLTEDSDQGAKARLSYNDYANRNRVWIPKKSPLALAAIRDVEGTVDHPNQAVRLDTQASKAMPKLTKGGRYFLDRRFTDFNLDRVLAELQDLDSEPDAAFVRLVEDPLAYRHRIQIPQRLRQPALDLANAQEMTPTQIEAFRGTLEHNLQLVWGPPGTGKTHFLALAILCLAEAHRKAGTEFRVLVTAFTHAAIDNCLRKIAELQDERQIVHGGLAVGKLGRTTLPDMRSVEILDEKKGWSWALGHGEAVVGGTVWAMRKGCEPGGADLLVIDEGSQMKVPESAIAIRRLRDDGRLLIAGDHLQLPPIVQAAYPDPAPGEPLVHRSIFECIQATEASDGMVAPLLENFRMNRTLCLYPAQQLYVAEYDSANEEIGGRRLALDGSPEDPIIAAIIDPEFPLVVGVLEGVRATAENRVEAALVAKTANAIRTHLLTDAGSSYPDSTEGDDEFWKHGLFVVSPHHAQIFAIRRALKAVREWRSRPFVDTVDTMQGQECDSVIVSYGVSDVEYAMNEKEFIYSLNRLNVSITRARSKTIVFLPRPLLEPPIQAFEDDHIAPGVAFMLGLVQFAEQHGKSVRHELEERAHLVLHRVGAREPVK